MDKAWQKNGTYNKANKKIVNLKNQILLRILFIQFVFQVTCEAVAVIGGTLANGGVSPITGEKVYAAKYDTGYKDPKTIHVQKKPRYK
mgnify:CR=1 FL=1